jgi:predicted DNA-binding transcriptional regulator
LFFPFGLALVIAARPGRARMVLLIVVGLLSAALQGWWVGEIWHFTPPSDYPP